METPKMNWPSETGDWSADNRTGRRLANEMLAAGDSIGLIHTIAGMVAAGRYGGIEAGFVASIALAAARG